MLFLNENFDSINIRVPLENNRLQTIWNFSNGKIIKFIFPRFQRLKSQLANLKKEKSRIIKKKSFFKLHL